jgi:hypothetical protein
VRNSEKKPLNVNAERITAGQNGATYGDQSSALISCHEEGSIFIAGQCKTPSF